jgi:hypothetical protein
MAKQRNEQSAGKKSKEKSKQAWLKPVLTNCKINFLESPIASGTCGGGGRPTY